MIGRAFQQGDLVYGLSGARQRYNDDGIFNSIFDNFGTIDQYPFNESDADHMGAISKLFPDDSKEFIANFENIEKYPDIKDIEIDPLTGKWINITDKEAAHTIARKCKRGLEWAAEKGKPAHFILDDINIKNVLDKDTTPGQSVTSRELRYVYRNRDNEIGKNVHFWKEGKEVEAPWDSEREPWKDYKPKRERTGEGETSSEVNTAARGVKRGAEDDAEHGMLKIIKKSTRDTLEEAAL
ncbi:hypothetical protein [Brucella sp. LJL56]